MISFKQNEHSPLPKMSNSKKWYEINLSYYHYIDPIFCFQLFTISFSFASFQKNNIHVLVYM